MKTIELTKADKRLRSMLKETQQGTVVLTEQGKPVAALVSVEGVDEETLSLSTNPRFLRILRRSFDELERGERVSLADMRKRLKS